MSMVDQKRNDHTEIRSIIIDTLIDAEQAKLRALKRLRREPGVERASRRVGRSQIDYVALVLRAGGQALHITEIIDRIHAEFDLQLDRESLVSALTKRVLRNDRFVRTGKNTFALKKEP